MSETPFVDDRSRKPGIARNLWFANANIERAFIYTLGAIFPLAHSGESLTGLIARALSFPLAWALFAFVRRIQPDADRP